MAASTAAARAGRLWCRLAAPFHHFDEAAGEPHAHFVQPDVALAFGRDLRKLAQHHEFGQRRQARGAPGALVAADQVDKARRQVKRQAFVAADMVVVGADVFVARTAHQHRAGDQFVRVAARAVAEAALAHVGDRVALVQLGVGPGTRARVAAVAGHADRVGLQFCGDEHGARPSDTGSVCER
jgi:hypothetical protein